MIKPTTPQLDIWMLHLMITLKNLRFCKHGSTNNLYWGKARGLALAARALGVITDDEEERLEALIENASSMAMEEAHHA